MQIFFFNNYQKILCIESLMTNSCYILVIMDTLIEILIVRDKTIDYIVEAIQAVKTLGFIGSMAIPTSSSSTVVA